MTSARFSKLTFAAFFAVTAFHDRADASVFMKATESGGNVVVSAEGTVNTQGMTFYGTTESSAGFNSSASFLEIAIGSADLYQSISGPASFGTGQFTFPSTGIGDRLGVRFGAGSIAVPAGYVSGAPLSGTSTFENTSFAQLGLVPGYYTWTWGSGTTADYLTLKIVDSSVPIQANVEIDANRHPVLRWPAELGSRYSISSSTDLINYVTIAKGFPFGGMTTTTAEFTDLPILTNTSPKAFYKILKDPAVLPKATDQLAAFYTANGGKAGFTDIKQKSLETVLYALEEIEAGQLVAARARIDAMLAIYPFSTDGVGWNEDPAYRGLNIGNPPGYYALRMLDQILTLGNPSRTGKLRMTAVVAATATVTRPTLPDYAPETVQLGIVPEILVDDAHRLHLMTRLFRRWVQAISGGLEVELKVHVVTESATVGYRNILSSTPGDRDLVLMLPEGEQIINSVPSSIANTTDLWWVIVPSGVPTDSENYTRRFVTGGMTQHSSGVPLLLSDDAAFTRKIGDLGTGRYSEVELMMYHPMWLQHEFMHYIYTLWPEFQLEVIGHQWFDRLTWPSDFVGFNEPDYYHESLTKRIFGSPRSVAQSISMLEYADMTVFPLAKLLGNYQRQPRENDWHDMTMSLTDGNLKWTNAAGLVWDVNIIGMDPITVATGGYDALKLRVQIDANDNVVSITFKGDKFIRIPTPVNRVVTNLKTSSISAGPSPFLLPRLPADGVIKCKTLGPHRCLSCY